MGRVFLVGAGPGDPDLLTMKAHRLLKEAEVVVYDRLVSQEILDLIPAGATRIFVGKAASNHQLPQEEINELLASLAKAGHRVVRLKGGDPFVFGRGGEEALVLTRHKVPFEVVPGITTASAVSAVSGIPLTHRALAAGVRFVTGHARNSIDLDLDWSKAADPDTTLVVYMGLTNLTMICDNLMAAGLPAGTPAAAIQNGTREDQRQLTATLAGLPAAVAAHGFTPPVLIIIGKVVGLAKVLNWQGLTFEEDAGLEDAAPVDGTATGHA
ncbi:MAG: uroporphyrinogen-III C-methyltransferase [Rhodobacterales bacterium]|nr:uroporphyrinogen-III C-methyltransferase [Rhodobacterales bacterium]